MKMDILEVVVSRLKVKRDTIMLDINAILSHPPSEGVSDRLLNKIEELSLVEQSLTHASSFYQQAVTQLSETVEKIKELNNTLEKNKK